MSNANVQPVCSNPISAGVSSADGGYTLCGGCMNWHGTAEILNYHSPEAARARVQAKRAAAIETTPANIGKAVARCVFERRGNHSEAHISENELAAVITEAVKLYATKMGRA